MTTHHEQTQTAGSTDDAGSTATQHSRAGAESATGSSEAGARSTSTEPTGPETESANAAAEAPNHDTESSGVRAETLITETDPSTSGSPPPSSDTESSAAGTEPPTAGSESSTAGTDMSLFAEHSLSGLRSRWDDVQSAFVDDPRDCVQKADALVSDVVDQLTSGFSEARSRLEEQWARGEEASTEDLRVALKRYREFFQRLLAV